MRYAVLAIVLTGAAMLGGCSEGVLDPKGPVAAAERLILFNSLGIMLAIVIPTILAILGVAWWFRSSNQRARYLPNFEFSGRLEILVWSIPAMTVLLVGGVAWVGSHDLDPRRLLSSTVKPVRVQVVSLDWKWLFIYPDQDIATVNQLTIPVGTPVSFELTSSGVMNSFFVPQLGSQIYTMAGMVTRLHLQADHPEHTGDCRPNSAAMVSPICASTSRLCQPKALHNGWPQRAAPVRCSMRKLMPIWPSRAARLRLSPIVPLLPTCSTAS
jgi:cytochrome o ubiquinol oxidase subunit 2